MNFINNLSIYKNFKQHTLNKKISFSGVGVHNGRAVSMSVEPAKINTGIVFKRTDISNKNTIKFKHIDPDLDPNLSSNLNIDRYLSGRDLPVLVFRLEESQRLSHIVGKDPNESIDIFNEKDVISGILISNQIKRKRIFFLSGHEERDINNMDRTSDSLGQARVTLERDNYDVSSITTDELSRIILNFSLSKELDLFFNIYLK